MTRRSIDKGVRQHRARILSATSHYETLELPPTAKIDAIKAAHRGLARIFHPDRCWLDDAHDIMTKVNGAYAVLSDTDARRRYDTINKTADGLCLKCNGSGEMKKMQGFKKKIVVTCDVCGGTGRPT